MKDYSYHPVNLGLRFILEIVVLIAAGMFAKEHFSWISAILLPVVLMTCWSVFAVRGDKSRSGKTVVPTPGKLRILIELLFFCNWNNCMDRSSIQLDCHNQYWSANYSSRFIGQSIKMAVGSNPLTAI